MDRDDDTLQDASAPVVHLRAATPDDGEWIEGFIRWGLSLADDPIPRAPISTRTPVELDVREPDHWPHDGLWIAMHDAEPVGMVRLIWRTETLSELELLRADPGWQDTRLAETLLAFAVERARSAGCRRLLLSDDVGDDAAHRLIHGIAWVRMERSLALALERAQRARSGDARNGSSPQRRDSAEKTPPHSRSYLDPRSDAGRVAAERCGPLAPPARPREIAAYIGVCRAGGPDGRILVPARSSSPR